MKPNFFSKSAAGALAPIATLVLVVWLWVTTRRATVVPGRGQWYTEQVYNFARNGIARDMIGSKDFLPFVPFLFSLFVFILLNNLFGIIPPFQNPTMARVAFPIGLTTAEVTSIMRGSDLDEEDPAATESELIAAVADGELVCDPAGSDALWRPAVAVPAAA